MSITNIYILENIVHGTPSGNYDGSSLAFDSAAVEAVNYYRGQGSLQTVSILVTGFQGRIDLEATLGDDPNQAAWFPVAEYEALAPTTENHPVSLVGNFVWMRARVTNFEAGTINRVLISY